MLDLFQEAITGYNLPFTILLGCVLLYWVVALVGVLDFEFLDGMLDLDGDIDADASADGGGIFNSILHFLNAADIPLIFVLSLISIFLWAGNLAGNHYLNGDGSGMLASVIAVGALVLSVFLTKFVTEPLKPLARMLKSSEGQEPITGRSGIVRSTELSSEFGQVEVESSAGAPLLLNARLSPDHDPVPRGEEVLVVSKSDEGDWYIVRPLQSSSESLS